MSPVRQADPELNNLIDEIIVDSHDEDEQLMGFEAAFDEDASFPCRAPSSARKWRSSPSAEATTVAS
jgi:hypothetical protein